MNIKLKTNQLLFILLIFKRIFIFLIFQGLLPAFNSFKSSVIYNGNYATVYNADNIFVLNLIKTRKKHVFRWTA